MSVTDHIIFTGHKRVGLTRHPGQLNAVVRELMPFAHRTDMNPQIFHFDLLDDKTDAAGDVGDGVAHGAVLEGFVFDVVTQQLIVWTPPLHRQLRDVSVVFIVV